MGCGQSLKNRPEHLTALLKALIDDEGQAGLIIDQLLDKNLKAVLDKLIGNGKDQEMIDAVFNHVGQRTENFKRVGAKLTGDPSHTNGFFEGAVNAGKLAHLGSVDRTGWSVIGVGT